MGQYYLPVNIETMEHVLSHDYGNGLKLMEHSYVGNNFVAVVEHLLSPQGPWHKAPLVWAGDYGDGGWYELASEDDKKMRPDEWALKPDPTLRFVVNHDKKQYVDLRKCKSHDPEWPYAIHPLPLLTADGNGAGGGDYHSGTHMDLIGTWAGDHISMERDEPAGYGLLEINFVEER